MKNTTATQFPATVRFEGVEYETISYSEACDHAQKNWHYTDGAVTGGGYFCTFNDDEGGTFVRLVHIRVNDEGVARLAYTEAV